MLLLMVVKSYQQCKLFCWHRVYLITNNSVREAREIGSSQLLHVVLKDGMSPHIFQGQPELMAGGDRHHLLSLSLRYEVLPSMEPALIPLSFEHHECDCSKPS